MDERPDPALDWSTPDGLRAITGELEGRLPGYRAPAAFAVALSPATSQPEWEFPHVNAPGGRHALAAVVIATVADHDGSTATVPLTSAHLDAAITSLQPAEACPDLDHPNLAAWRAAARALEDNPAREAVLVWVADLDDPVSSDADGEMRATFEDLHPRT